jgi:ribonuclease R
VCQQLAESEEVLRYKRFYLRKRVSNPKELKSTTGETTGKIKRHPDGFGFVIPDEPGLNDIFIPKPFMSSAMSQDRVSIYYEPDLGAKSSRFVKNSPRLRGEVLKILERGLQTVVGIFVPRGDGKGLIRDADHGWGEDLLLSVPQHLSPKENDLVVAKIKSYPGEKNGFLGEVIQVLGSPKHAASDIERVIHTAQIPHQFSKTTHSECEKLKSFSFDQNTHPNRKDLRKLGFVTIDGATAKDFDDAVFVETVGKNFRLWVAVADVSFFVSPGTALDEDAYARSTSTYFPNFVVPMLPPILSEELCSLKPNLDRFALVCELLIDPRGEIISFKFHEALIKSHARLTYGQAQEIIEGIPERGISAHRSHAGKAKLSPNDSSRRSDLAPMLAIAKKLAQILMDKRFKEGSLELNVPDVQILVNDQGEPFDVVVTERLFAHRLIEEFMLVANIAAAKFLAEKKIPTLFRVHEAPDQESIHKLMQFLKTFGYKKSYQGGESLPKFLTEALQFFSGTPQEPVLTNLTLRSMSQAKYSPHNVGHFGLGFEFYSHFTSPIRRYPDLVVHRLIRHQLIARNQAGPPLEEMQRFEEILTKKTKRGGLTNKNKRAQKSKPTSGLLYDLETLTRIGVHASACEQRSVKAERELVSIKKARYMEKFLGQEFKGVISSVTRFGVFVLIKELGVDGLIHVDQLSDQFDQFDFDEERLCLRGRRSKAIYKIGDTIKIIVAATDPIDGKVDFVRAHSKLSSGGSLAKEKYRPVMSLQDILENAKKSSDFDPEKALQRAQKNLKQKPTARRDSKSRRR